MMRTQGTIIVLMNFIVLVTLATKKSKFPTVYWLQIVCLAFNDMLAGIANFAISWIDLPHIKKELAICSIVVVFLYSSQSASLYNIFGICIHRFVVLKRADRNVNVWKHKHTLLCTSAAWVLSIFLCSLPVALYNKPDEYRRFKLCSLKPIFGKDIDKGMFIMIGSFIVPLIFTNIMYIILFVMLNTVFKSVQPVSTQTQTDTGSSNTDNAFFNRGLPSTSTVVSNKSLSSEKSQVQEPRVQTERMSARSSLFLKVPKRQNTIKLLSVKNLTEQAPSTRSQQVTIYSPQQLESKRSAYQTPTVQTLQYTPPMILRQRRAFALLGVILLFLNIFSWPAITALLLTSMVHTISLDRNTLLPLFTTICFNSVVNPILYTATITEFRSALLDMLNYISKMCKR